MKETPAEEVCSTCLELKQIEREHNRNLARIRKDQEERSRQLEKKLTEESKKLEEELAVLQNELTTKRAEFEQRVLATEAARLIGQRPKEEIEEEISAIENQMKIFREQAQTMKELAFAENEKNELQAAQQAMAQREEANKLMILANTKEADENSHLRRQEVLAASLAKKQLAANVLEKAEAEMSQLAERLSVLKEQTSRATEACCTCSGDIPLTKIITCPSKHVYCEDCFANLVTSHAEKELVTRMKVNGLVSCPGTDGRNKCSHLFTTRFIAIMASQAVFDRHQQSVDEVKERRVLDAEEARRKLEEDRLAHDSVGKHFLHITEKLLNIACPRCKAAFNSFDACTALTCSTCKCGFCAWCFEDCGADAHAHIAQKHPDKMFVRFDEWEAFHDRRKKADVERYMEQQKLSPEVVKALKERLKALL